MEIILVWILLVSSSTQSGFVSYSPPVATLEDCQRLQNRLDNYLKSSSACIQINVIVKK